MPVPILSRLIRRRELRQGGYTQAIVNTWQALAHDGQRGADPASLAAIAACARVWSDALASVAVTGPPALDHRFLAMLGADLIRRGHSRWKIRVANGMIRLERPALAQRTAGGWILTWNRDPGDNTTEQVLPGEVLNVRWEHSPHDDWTGIAPWSGVTGRLLAELTAQGGDLAAGPGGYLIALQGANAPGADQQAAAAAAGNQLPDLSGKRRGKLAFLVAGGGASSRFAGESGSVRPAQLGYKPEPGHAPLQTQLTAELSGACGVPVSLVDGSGGAAAIREGQRVFGIRLGQRCNRLAAELTDQLGTPVTLDASAVFRQDIALRSRSYKALVDAGMDPGMAATLTGLVETDP